MTRLGIVAVLVGALCSVWAPALAQDGPLPVTPGAGKYLPAAAALGEGWEEQGRRGIAPGPELFREGVKAVYGGPAGARAVLFAWVIQDSATAVRRSWAATSEFMDQNRRAFASDDAWSRTEGIETAAPPPGCAEAARAEGANPASEYPAGLTMCAVDPDVILLAVVSGELAGGLGVRASDALIAHALAAAGGAPATPESATPESATPGP